MSEKEDRIENSYSRPNGIIFYAKKNGRMCVESFVDEAGEEHVRIIPVYLLKIKKYIQKYERNYELLYKKFRTIWAILSILIFLTLIVAFHDFKAIISAGCISLYVIPQMVILGNTYWNIKSGRNEMESSAGRFRSAEHMVISAYNRLARVPTVEEIKKEPHFYKFFEFDFLFTRSIVVLWCAICLLLNIEKLSLAICMILAICGIIFICFLGWKGVFSFLQIFITADPTDKEIRLAQKGIELLDRLENGDVTPEDYISSEEIDELLS